MDRRTFRTVAVAALAAAAVQLAVAPAAACCAPEEARIDGPGLTAPVVVQEPQHTKAQPDDGPVWTLAKMTGAWNAFYRIFGLDSEAPGGDLGPRYEVMFTGWAGSAWADVQIHPYAPDGPHAYVQVAGEKQRSNPGWHRAPYELVDLLIDLGVPLDRDIVAHSSPQPSPTPAVSVAASRADDGPRPDLAATYWIIGGVVLSAAGLSALLVKLMRTANASRPGHR